MRRECASVLRERNRTRAAREHAKRVAKKPPWGNYFDQFKDMKRISFGITDGAAGTVWDKMRSANIYTMADSVRRCLDFLGPEKDLLLGRYMWDFTLGAPVAPEKREQQLAHARAFLAEKTVTGLIFHPSFIAALDVPAVKLAKEWIRSHGESVWGTRSVGARRFF